MTNDDSALREVDQELAEDRQWAVLRQYGPMIGAGALALVLSVGGWQFYKMNKSSAAMKAATEYRAALDTLALTPDDGRTAMAAIEENSQGGYASLAAMQRAAIFAKEGKRDKAAEIYRGIVKDGAASKQMRDLARIRAGYMSLPYGREAVMRELGSLGEEASPFSYYARELLGMAAVDAEDYETAHSIFQRLSIDLDAPAVIRERASEFAAVAAAAKAGVDISSGATTSDLTDILDTAPALDVTPVMEDAGDVSDEVIVEVPAAGQPVEEVTDELAAGDQ